MTPRELGRYEPPAKRDNRPSWRVAAARGSSSRRARRAVLLWAVLLVALFAWTTPGVLPWLWRKTHERPEAPVVLGWSFTAARGSAGDRTSDQTIAMNPSANLVVGAIIVVFCASDDQAATGETTAHTVTDSQSNKWHKIREHTTRPGAANTGVTGSVWLCKVTTQIATTDTITLTVTSSVTAKCLGAIEVSSTAGAWDCIDVQIDVGTDSSPTPASLTIKSAAVLALGLVFCEDSSSAIVTEDADYTSRLFVRSGSSGGAGANVCCGIATRIATLTADTYGPTTATCDHIGMVVLLREAAVKTRTRMVKSSGGHYTSYASWESAQQADIAAAQEIRQAELWELTSDEGGTTTAGWTTSSTYYVRAYTPTDERHDGFTPGSGFRFDVSSGNGFVINSLHVRVEGVELKGNTSSFGFMCEPTAGNSADIRIEKCLVYTWSIGLLASTGSSGTTHVMRWGNNIVYGCIQNGMLGNDADTTVYAYNNTLCDCGTNSSTFVVARFAGTFTPKNNIVQNPNDALGASSTQYDGTFTGAEYNLSGDATAPGTNSRTSKTVTFNAPASDDFRLGASDSEATDFGKDLSGDSNFPFSVDILGTTRPLGSAWDMGAHEREASAQLVTPDVASSASSGIVLSTRANVPAVASKASSASALETLLFLPFRAAGASAGSVLFTLSQIPGVGTAASSAIDPETSISTVVIPPAASSAATAAAVVTLSAVPTLAELDALAQALVLMGYTARADAAALATSIQTLIVLPGAVAGAGSAVAPVVSVATVVIPAVASANASASAATALALVALAQAVSTGHSPLFALLSVPARASGAGAGRVAMLLELLPGNAAALAAAIDALAVITEPPPPDVARGDTLVRIEVFAAPPRIAVREAPGATDVFPSDSGGRVAP